MARTWWPLQLFTLHVRISMRENWVRQKLNRGEPTIGCFIGLGSPHVAELLAHAGYDWLVLETEHSAVDIAQVEHMMMAISGADTIPIVRVMNAEPIVIQRALDAGAFGILVPMVRTAADIEAIVKSTRYPPVGERGFGPLRASRYAKDYAEYARKANDNIIVSIIIETKEAIENIEEIAAVPGLDGMFLGLFDLSISYGLDPLELPHPEIDAAIARTLAAGNTSGVAVGMGSSTPEELLKLRKDGFTYLAYGSDYSLLTAGARGGLDAFDRGA